MGFLPCTFALMSICIMLLIYGHIEKVWLSLHIYLILYLILRFSLQYAYKISINDMISIFIFNHHFLFIKSERTHTHDTYPHLISDNIASNNIFYHNSTIAQTQGVIVAYLQHVVITVIYSDIHILYICITCLLQSTCSLVCIACAISLFLSLVNMSITYHLNHWTLSLAIIVYSWSNTSLELQPPGGAFYEAVYENSSCTFIW